MLLFQQNKPGIHLVVLFGVGLIGSTLASRLSRTPGVHVNIRGDRRSSNASELSQLLKKLYPNDNINQINTVWCAGKAGFAAEKIDAELEDFKAVLSWLENTRVIFPNASFSFHLMSSAGGLYENQRAITSTSYPQPLRPYGDLKLRQEQHLSMTDNAIDKHIYRPTSVYSKFMLVILFAWGINMLVVLWTISLGVNSWLAQALGVLPYAVLSYLGLKYMVFGKRT